jgi:two-component system, NarL family, sensor kinase
MGEFNHPRRIVGLLVAIILSLEVILPNQYMVGYAYVVPILFATYRINAHWGKWVTIIAGCLTLLYCFDAQHLRLDTIPMVVFFNRILAVLALVVAYRLSLEVRTYSELAANRQAEITFQASIAQLNTDYAANLVHDLQTPLIGAVETINGLTHGDFGAVTAEQKHAFDIMRRSHTVGIYQLQTILAVCQNEHDGLYLNYRSTDLEKIATNAIETLADLAKSRQVKIEWVNQCATTQIECDPDRIERVFTNLILNAIYQSRPHSSVVVSIQAESNQYLVRIIDRGKGIKPADLPSLFVKYYQGEIGRRSKGAGLGLYLVRQIIETHGGTIQVEPIVAKGVTFLFNLPKVASEA